MFVLSKFENMKVKNPQLELKNVRYNSTKEILVKFIYVAAKESLQPIFAATSFITVQFDSITVQFNS